MSRLKYNNAKQICREVMVRIARGILENNLGRIIDRIPLEMRPNSRDAIRCCIYKDRAVIKYRCMAVLGMPAEEETDELTPLSEYARRALNGEFVNRRLLTVLDVACSTCQKSHYYITNACKGCAARPCTLVCHKKAIRVRGGQAEIDMDQCVNCGKCLQACPYHAIVHIPVPCQEACAVRAIRDGEHGQKVIDFDKCIGCGKCLGACPFGAVMECSQMVNVLKRLRGRGHVTALAAPALAGQFPAGWKQVEQALRRLGFDRVIEVAVGADRTIEHEAAELQEKLAKGQPFMTTSCCPSYVQAVHKHLPEMAPFVSDTPSPMEYAARLAKQEHPDTATVFIGPCLAKRTEAARSEVVDYVLTFEELGAILVAAEVLPDEQEESPPTGLAPSAEARRFPVSGSVAAAVARACANPAAIKPVQVENLDKKTLALLRQYAKGDCPGNLLEVMACQGGCIGGPCALQTPTAAKKTIEKQNPAP